jgi:hypothetical protein
MGMCDFGWITHTSKAWTGEVFMIVLVAQPIQCLLAEFSLLLFILNRYQV